MIGSRYDVFLSYSRADQERVAPLRDELRRLGYSVFFDVESIDPGRPWKRRLERSIRGSRALVLCWSQHTRGSDYITFEYSRAEALHKPVYPWLLDATPLPAMLEVQGISAATPAEVAARLRPALGWTARRRHGLWLAAALVVAAVLAVTGWRWLHPPAPSPWAFRGEVTNRLTRMPIAGVEVDLMSGNEVQAYAVTDARGRFDLHLPQPRPRTIRLRFRKAGYEGDEQTVSTDTPQPFPEDLSNPQ